MKFIFALFALVFITTEAFALPTFNPQLVLKNQQGETSVFAPQAGSNYVANFKAATVTLTAAQVIALNATPIQLVAAKTGYVIQVVAVEMKYTKSTAFGVTSGKKLIVQYHTSAVAIGNVAEVGFIDQSSSKTAFVYGAGTGGVSVDGAAVEITSDDSSITSGTSSTVAVTVYYNLLKVL